MLALSSRTRQRVPADLLASLQVVHTLVECRLVPYEPIGKEVRRSITDLCNMLEEGSSDFRQVQDRIGELHTVLMTSLKERVKSVLFKGAGRYTPRQKAKLIRVMIHLDIRPSDEEIRANAHLTIGELGEIERQHVLSFTEAITAITELFTVVQVNNDRHDTKRWNARG